MYKLQLLIVLLAALFASCRSHEKAKTVKKKPAKTASTHIINPVMEDFPVSNPGLKEFKSFLKGLDLSMADNAIVAVKKYDELFANDDVKIRDTAFVLFNQFHFKLSMRMDDLHNRDTTIQYDSLLTDSNGIHSLKISAKTAAYDKLLKTIGLRVTSEEGETYIVQDFDFEILWFKAQLSEPVLQYLTQTAKEDKEGLAEDAGLVITPKKLAERTVWWEDFLAQYPNIIVSLQAKYNRDGGLSILLTGMDNSPVLMYSPFSLDESYAAAYKFLQTEYPNSKTNQVINPFYKLAIKKDSIGVKNLIAGYEKQGVIETPENEGD